MTEQEAQAIREALIEQYAPNRITFDTIIEWGVYATAIISLAYFTAHVLAYLVGA